jgi:hypothetical protein
MRGRLRTCDTRKLLVGSDPAMRAALARVMLDTLRELVDTHQDSEAVRAYMRFVLTDAEREEGEPVERRVLN